MTDKQIKWLAKCLALHCYRNTQIEDLHAGLGPSSLTGDFSDVKVVTPFGEIPWNELSRISDEEMCALNKKVINKLYTMLRFLFREGFLPKGIPFYDPSNWDEPKVDREMNRALGTVKKRMIELGMFD